MEDNRLVTVITFHYPDTEEIARHLLEVEGIDVFVKDKLTVQTYHFISQASGGVKLQVKAHDYEKAQRLLTDAGYITDDPNASNPLFVKLTKLMDKLRFFPNQSIQARFTAFLIVLGLLIVGFIYLIIYFPSLST